MSSYGKVVMLTLLTALPVLAQPIGQTTSPLVSNNIVPTASLESHALVSVDMTASGRTCSGTLIAHNFALTAAHCIDTNPPGPFNLLPVGSVRATWSQQTRPISNVTFFPDDKVDLALLELDGPIRKDGKHFGAAFPQLISADGLRPSESVALYGKGFYRFAVRQGGQDLPTLSDGQYRSGFGSIRTTTDKDIILHMFSGLGSGDSGGPWYAVRNGAELGIVGVTSGGQVHYLNGHSAPPTGIDEAWVSSVGEVTASRVDVVSNKINGAIAADLLLHHPPRETKTFARTFTDWENPQLNAENGLPYRLDACLNWGANCGQAAANAFCAMKSPSRPAASHIETLSNAGATTVFSSRRRCKGPGCVAIKKLRCNATIVRIPR